VYFVSETAQVELTTWTSVSPWYAVEGQDVLRELKVGRCRLTPHQTQAESPRN